MRPAHSDSVVVVSPGTVVGTDAASLDGAARTLDVLSNCSGTDGDEMGAAAGSSNGLKDVFADNVFALEIN